MNIEVLFNSVFFQIFLAMFLGALLGVERSFAGKTAGMRTYGLVAMGSCLFVIIATLVGNSFGGGIASFDQMRVATGAIMGIGFLGGGVIIFKEEHLSGLTTAAGLWIACGIGLSVGYGFYALALATTILTLFTFTVLWFIEHKITTRFSSKVEINK